MKVPTVTAPPSHVAGTKAGGGTIVLGLEHFIDKIGYQAAEYARRGIDVLYLVLDKSGLSGAKARRYGARVDVVPVPLRERILFTIRAFRRERPRYCELYDIGRLTLLYALIARAAGARLIMILRGMELAALEGRALRRAGLRAALRLSDQIVAKELNIVRDLAALGVPGGKVTFIGNCVPMPEQPPAPVAEREIDILFLNSVRRMRNPDLLVRALPRVLQEVDAGRVVIAGFTHLDGTGYRIEEETEHQVLALIDELGLRDRVEVHGFVAEPGEFYRRAKVFVLPADVVFANYSLLEAMSYGVVPLVGDGEGAGRIVRDGDNGRIVPRTPDALADALITLLRDPPQLERLATRARDTIEQEFSIRRWGEEMVGVRGRVG